MGKIRQKELAGIGIRREGTVRKSHQKKREDEKKEKLCV